MILLYKLFTTFFMIGAVAFGGGYVMIPLIDRQIVEQLHWLTGPEFADVVAIAEMTPGPIAVNAATFVGFKLAGPAGSIVATVGVILPSFLLVLLLATLVSKISQSPKLAAALSGIRPVVVGLITSAVWSLGHKTLLDLKSWIVAAAILMALLRTRVHPIWLIFAAGVTGMLFF